MGARRSGSWTYSAVADLLQKELQVVALGESGELAAVVEAHIEQAPHAFFSQSAKEGRGAVGLRESDRADL